MLVFIIRYVSRHFYFFQYYMCLQTLYILIIYVNRYKILNGLIWVNKLILIKHIHVHYIKSINRESSICLILLHGNFNNVQTHMLIFQIGERILFLVEANLDANNICTYSYNLQIFSVKVGRVFVFNNICMQIFANLHTNIIKHQNPILLKIGFFFIRFLFLLFWFPLINAYFS